MLPWYKALIRFVPLYITVSGYSVNHDSGGPWMRRVVHFVDRVPVTWRYTFHVVGRDAGVATVRSTDHVVGLFAAGTPARTSHVVGRFGETSARVIHVVGRDDVTDVSPALEMTFHVVGRFDEANARVIHVVGRLAAAAIGASTAHVVALLLGVTGARAAHVVGLLDVTWRSTSNEVNLKVQKFGWNSAAHVVGLFDET